MAERFVDSFKTELIADRVWRTRTELELASSTSAGSTPSACTNPQRGSTSRVGDSKPEQHGPTLLS
jgi:hypothetical protein